MSERQIEKILVKNDNRRVFSLFEKSDKECLVNLEDGGYQILARDGWTKLKD